MQKLAIQSKSDSTVLNKPVLKLPLQRNERPRPYLRPAHLQQWAAEIPIGNTTVAAQQLIEQLEILNTSRYPARERLQLQNVLRPAVFELAHAMRQSIRQAVVPLDYRTRYNVGLLQTVLENMALGYKLIINDLSSARKLRELDNLIMQESVYLAMIYLSQRLIDAYSLYQPEPENVWYELNQLYLFAETKQFLQNNVDDLYPDNSLLVSPTIEFVYQRIVLLAMSEPYHLMQYEADEVFRQLVTYVKHCTIENYHQMVSEGDYAIDLAADQGPRFISTGNRTEMQEPRVIEISRLKHRLDAHLQRLLSNNARSSEFDAASLVDRQQRDMLLRLSDAWHASLVRKTRRFQLRAGIEMGCGLNTSHHFISRGAQFTPEINELKLFSDTDDSDKEIQQLFASSYRDALQKDRKHGFQQYHLNPWQQYNISPLGVALTHAIGDSNIDVRVGELVAYRNHGKTNQRWQVGVIRWLQQNYLQDGESEINIGIMNIATGAIAIGVKAIKGIGGGTDYFRGLLLPEQSSLQKTRSMVLPAFLYDVGTVLVVNQDQRLFHIRLTRVILSTRSFTQFDYEIVRQPLDYSL